MPKQKYQYGTDTKKVAQNDGAFVPNWITLPKGTKFFGWRVREDGKNTRINILPFVVGKGNPEAAEGTLHYRRVYFIHDKIGTGGRDGQGEKVCCNQMNGKGKCAVCDGLAQIRREGASYESTKDFNPRKRHLYAVEDLQDNEIKVHESSPFKGLGDLIQNKIMADEDDLYSNFWHLEEGQTANILVKKENFPGGSFSAPSNLEFTTRKKNYDDSDLEKIPCLDDCVVTADYDKVWAMFMEGKSEPEETMVPSTTKAKKDLKIEEDEDEPKSKKKPKVVEEEATDDPKHTFKVGDKVKFEYRDEEYEGKIVKIIDDEIARIDCGEEKPRTVNIDELFPVIETKKKPKVVEEDDEEPKPKKKSKVVEEDDEPKAKPKKPVVEDDEDDTPPPPRKRARFEDDED